MNSINQRCPLHQVTPDVASMWITIQFVSCAHAAIQGNWCPFIPLFNIGSFSTSIGRRRFDGLVRVKHPSQAASIQQAATNARKVQHPNLGLCLKNDFCCWENCILTLDFGCSTLVPILSSLLSSAPRNTYQASTQETENASRIATLSRAIKSVKFLLFPPFSATWLVRNLFPICKSNQLDTGLKPSRIRS